MHEFCFCGQVAAQLESRVNLHADIPGETPSSDWQQSGTMAFPAQSCHIWSSAACWFCWVSACSNRSPRYAVFCIINFSICCWSNKGSLLCFWLDLKKQICWELIFQCHTGISQWHQNAHHCLPTHYVFLQQESEFRPALLLMLQALSCHTSTPQHCCFPFSLS